MMANRSDRGSGHPDGCLGHNSPQSRMGPDPRNPSRPAVTITASTGRTQDCTRPPRQHFKSFLATREPSTQDIRARMSEVRGKADVQATWPGSPLLARRRHCSHQRKASPHENNARQSRVSQRGSSPLLSSNNRTSRHPRYIIRRLTITPPINPAQSTICPWFNPLYSNRVLHYKLLPMTCALYFRCPLSGPKRTCSPTPQYVCK